MAGKSVSKAGKMTIPAAERKAARTDANERKSELIRELTAIQAQADAVALAIAGNGADAFRDNELSAVLFDIEERLMHVRCGFESLPMFPEAASHV